MIKHHKDIHNS